MGPEPEHFIVEEIPLYEASGEGEHLYVFVEKRDLATPQMIRQIARAAGVGQRDVGSAGMKDKQAVTRQWLSLPGKSRPPEEWDLDEGIRVVRVSRHKNKLRTGHLLGNRFVITLVDVPEDGLSRARAIAARIADRRLPNYFGTQRFGVRGSSYAQAFEWLAETPKPDSASTDGKKKHRRGPKRFENKFLPSVVQSEIFNRYVTARLARPEPLLAGEVVRLDGTGSLFVVEDLAAEVPRFERGDLHRTGPMWGPKGVQAQAAARELELTVLSEVDLDDSALAKLAKHAPGTRRDLFLEPRNLRVDAPAPGQLTVSFELDAGSYATQLVRELTHRDWFEPR